MHACVGRADRNRTEQLRLTSAAVRTPTRAPHTQTHGQAHARTHRFMPTRVPMVLPEQSIGFFFQSRKSAAGHFVLSAGVPVLC